MNYITIALAIIPTSLCLYYYVKIGLKEYLFVGIAFVFGILTVYSTLLYSSTTNLLLQQLITFSFINIYLFFLLFAIRINWYRPPKIAYLGILWYLFLVYSIISFKLTSVNDEMNVLFVKMNKNPYSPSIVGIFEINGIIISGWGFEFIYDLFRMYVFGLILYMYLKTDLPVKTTYTRKLWKVWILAVSIHLVGTLLEIGVTLGFWKVQQEIISGILLITLILIAYIAIRHPEAFFITHTQMIRAFALYGNAQKLENERRDLKFGLLSIVDYIKSVPDDYKRHLKEEK